MINDNYFAFWFRYVLPNKVYLEAGLAEDVWERSKDDFNIYLGLIFEKLVRNPEVFLRLTGFHFTKLGRWWRRGEEVNVLALNEREKKALLIEVKWKELSKREAKGILRDLGRKAELVGLDSWKRFYGVVAKKIDDMEELREEGWLAWDLRDFEGLAH
ncbi:Hypothetical protein PAB1413 [Pyrococcus abyssi GE5]|uniref:DUF234 domain-containing protein n=1 Tax=Pyrococcus abyssi (strain GE5 / Orsay) TaxID=272844 RepID=Q9UYQ1_PYRAB|nr:Hypothetical protein PAB1413 [Pyrococcus abyssi GE5]CCE70902.1 TPA: hypothetical protein PAB1413 [Pyrococcus abyssi GE5]